MTDEDLTALLPLLVLAATAVAVLLLVGIRRHHLASAVLTAVGLGATCAVIPLAEAVAPRAVTPLLVVDRFGLLYIGLFAVAAIAVVGMAYSYLKDREEQAEELYILLVLATLGASVLATSRHLVSLFLGLETLSVSLYGMISYWRSARRSVEAGLKYLLLAASSSAFLLLGLALIYADTGTMELFALARVLSGGQFHTAWVLAGIGLVLTGAGFKLAAVPFHLWTPDVYEGAPAPVTAFIATVSKGGMLALLLRYFTAIDALRYPSMQRVIAVMAVASMFVGNLLALRQDNVKRLLAYSSIAHMGYMLVAFLAAGPLAVEAVTFYLLAYFATTLGAFAVVTVLSGKDGDLDQLAGYRGLFWRRPVLGAVMSAMLFSLAGIPLTAGFVGKFYVLAAGVGGALWGPVLALAVNSVIGLYYYLRLVVSLYTPIRPGEVAAPGPSLSLAGGVVLVGLAVLLVWLGVAPSGFIAMIRPPAVPL